MLDKLPKPLLVSLLLGGGIFFMIANDPPYTFCDSQVENFKKIQKGILYKNPKDFHKEKSILKRKENTCLQENAPGACYEYFAYVRRLLRDFRVLSNECISQISSTNKVKRALSEALTLMVAIAWREEVLTGRESKFNWLTRADLILFCELKNKYITYYGQKDYSLLENKILTSLPIKKPVALKFLIKKTILSESCITYK